MEGSFALAYWDADRRRLSLARDPFGRRPLFWAGDGARVAFASDVATLLRQPWVSAEPALDRLAEYLSFRYVHAPATLLRDVRQVPPGHVVQIDAHGVTIERWWNPGWSRPGALPTEVTTAARAVDEAVRRSVHRRLADEGPVAVLLSGGLDSSAILHHAHAVRPEVLATTVSLADDPADESPFAARVASVIGARHEVHRIASADLIAAVDRCTRAMGQPLPSPAGVVQALIFERLAGAGVTRLLSGDGGDEVLGGRGMEQIAARLLGSRLVSTIPRPARGIARRLARRAGLRDLAVAPRQFGADRLIGGSRVFKSHERVEVLADIGLTRPGIRRTVLDPLYQEVDSDPLNQILHVWQRGWLVEDSLARAERMAAAAGVTVRYPMLDRRLVALANGWTGDTKVRRQRGRIVTKAPLRRAMAGRLPRRLLDRDKRSLPAPLDRWLRGPGRSFLRERIDAVCDDPAGTWNADGVRRLLHEHVEGDRNHGLKLW
ncbi:MAG: asparagine synthetase B, partial [Deltaproteobacteria bacterium]